MIQSVTVIDSSDSETWDGDTHITTKYYTYQEVAKAVVIAGATEAFRMRNQPGDWMGPKGTRILTAAIDGLVGRVVKE